MAVLAPIVTVPSTLRSPPQEALARGWETITDEDLLRHLVEVASPELEGRDSPSLGLDRAADYLERALAEADVLGGAGDGSFRLGFAREYTVPDPAGCALEFRRGDGGAFEPLVVGEDVVALPYCEGAASGELVFAGFGITDSKERYDDLRSVRVRDKIALIVEGEPRHKRLFDGPPVTPDADVHGKVENLRDAGAVGVLVARRPLDAATEREGGPPLEPPALGFRYSWAYWFEPRPMPMRKRELEVPVFEISMAAASRLLGDDVDALARKIEKSGKPPRRSPGGVQVRMKTAFHRQERTMDNIVGLVPGADPDLADEYVVLGAHYDHLGVDPWGRIGYGADDNGSGTAALLELAEALAVAQPRRSVLVAFFAAEEDGLIGSRWFCSAPPVAASAMVAMINMDMLGRGETDELYVLGTDQTPAFEDVLDRAKKLHETRVRKVYTGKGRGFWERSDHFSFHEIGVPVLFFFENYPESENPDYHTYRDTIETLDLEKVLRSTRFVFNTAWLIANDDGAPPRPAASGGRR